MRTLFLERTADGLLDLAWRASLMGHDVRYFCATYDQHKNPVGRGIVEREADFARGVRWAELIVAGGNDFRQRDLDVLRRDGKLVVGSSAEAAEWESDRSKGMGVLRRVGIPVPAYREFTDYDTAIAYVKKQGRPFVSKPSGHCDDKSLSYVAKSPADLIYMLERWKRAGKRTGQAFILQEKIAGVEVSAGAWFGPDGFVEDWETNFEHKKLMAGNLGPNCYSADTEVLTEDGWKFWPDVVADDRIATLVDGNMVFERPSQLVAAPFDGEMIAWQSSRLDILVTPGHQMHVADRDEIRRGRMNFHFVPAHEAAACSTEKKFAVLRTAGWEGEGGSTPAEARLIGMFLADGYCRRHSIVFGNCPPHKQAIIRKAALELGLTANLYGKDLYINSKWLTDLCREFPGSVEKRAPPEIMAASPAVIAAFLDGLALDATTRKGNLTYTTASRGMADDIQTMVAKIGGCGIIRERDRRDEPDRFLAGYVVHGSLSWDVGVSFHSFAWLRPRFCRRVPYRGMVYCATVSTHVLYVRRNGKPCWNGQTGEMGSVSFWSRKSKLARQVLKPLETELHRAGFVGCVDVNCLIDEDGTVHPLEFTTRGGWPALNLEASMFTHDFVEFFADLARGKPPKTVHRMDEIVLGVVVAIPDFPYSHATRKEVIGVPIYGLTRRIMGNIHPAQMMAGEAPDDEGKHGPCCVTAGDYVLIATGSGATVQAARRSAYATVRQIEIPASPFHRNDIGARLAKDLETLHFHGYALGINYS